MSHTNRSKKDSMFEEHELMIQNLSI